MMERPLFLQRLFLCSLPVEGGALCRSSAGRGMWGWPAGLQCCRSRLRRDCPVLLAARWCSPTHCAPCGRYVQTWSASQLDEARAARVPTSPLRFSAPTRRPAGHPHIPGSPRWWWAERGQCEGGNGCERFKQAFGTLNRRTALQRQEPVVARKPRHGRYR